MGDSSPDSKRREVRKSAVQIDGLSGRRRCLSSIQASCAVLDVFFFLLNCFSSTEKAPTSGGGRYIVTWYNPGNRRIWYRRDTRGEIREFDYLSQYKLVGVIFSNYCFKIGRSFSLSFHRYHQTPWRRKMREEDEEKEEASSLSSLISSKDIMQLGICPGFHRTVYISWL